MKTSPALSSLLLSAPAAFLVFLAAGVLTGLQAGAAQTLWNGPTISFTKTNLTDWHLAANQDRMTADVWITRDTTQGIFNAATESSFTHFLSPQNTEWSYGTLANYATLTYSNWEAWNGSSPPSMIGRDAVLHLISDDIYLSIKFTSWGGNLGGFSYNRSTPAVPEPSSALLMLTGLVAAAVFRGPRRPLR